MQKLKLIFLRYEKNLIKKSLTKCIPGSLHKKINVDSLRKKEEKKKNEIFNFIEKHAHLLCHETRTVRRCEKEEKSLLYENAVKYFFFSHRKHRTHRK